MNYSIFNAPHPAIQDITMEHIGPSPDRHALLAEIDSLKVNHIILKTSPYVLFVCNLQELPAFWAKNAANFAQAPAQCSSGIIRQIPEHLA